MVRQKAAQRFALLVHELTTNAVKYGALSVPAGRVVVPWKVDRESHPDRFVLCWEETGGPIVVPPTRTGYGGRSSSTQCGASASIRSSMRPRA